MDFEKIFRVAADTLTRRAEAAKQRVALQFETMIRDAVIQLDALDPKSADWFVDMARDVLNRVADERRS